MTRTPLPRAFAQISALTRTFLARFFDNEMTGGSTNLQHAFFWLLSALAMPGLAMPNISGHRWAGLALAPDGGLEVLRMQAGQDLTFALGVTMFSVGAVATITWQALLIERRDVQVLGSFPVRHRTVLFAKLCALVLFFAMLAAAMFPLSALFYGLHLGAQFSVPFGFRLAAAHVVVSTVAGLTTYLAVVALQGTVLSIAGPRVFARIAPLLQLGVVGAIGILLLSLPAVAHGALGAIYATGPEQPAVWVLWMPPTWFYGLYEQLLGSTLPVLDVLAGRALLALATVTAVVLVTYPLAYGRMVIDALVGAPAPARLTPLRRAVASVPPWISRSPVAQATVQFVLSTLGRVGVHRLVVSMALGVAMAIVVPITAANLGPLPATPPASLLALPVVLMAFTIIGLRIAYALPAELAAAWLFRAAAGRDWAQHRIAARRILLALGVLLPIAITVPFYAAGWGILTALLHGSVCVALGTLMVEALMVDFDGVPCSAPFEPGHAQLESRWPWYVIGLGVALIAIPANEAELFRARFPTGVLIFAAVLGAGAAVVRKWSAFRRPAPVTQDTPGPASFSVLIR